MAATVTQLLRPKRKPTISVVMVSYMTGPALMEAVRSVIADPDITEFIIVDNGNSESARHRLCQLAMQSEKIRLLQGHGNIGFAKACNYGAKISTGEYLLFLNPDAVISPGAALKLAECGKTLTRPWIVGAMIRDEFGREQRGSRREHLTPYSAFVTFTGLSRLPFFKSLHLEADPLPGAPTPIPVISGACSMVDRVSFDMLGGFDEAYFLHVEDIDICERVHQQGGDVYFHPSATAMHYGSTSSATRQEIEYQKLKGFTHYFLKYAKTKPAKLFTYITLPFMALAIMGRAWLLALRQGLTGR